MIAWHRQHKGYALAASNWRRFRYRMRSHCDVFSLHREALYRRGCTLRPAVASAIWQCRTGAAILWPPAQPRKSGCGTSQGRLSSCACMRPPWIACALQ
jgi:hypothetical protein